MLGESSYNVISKFDWSNQARPEYSHANGRLEYHHVGFKDERVLTSSQDEEVRGASNGRALEVITGPAPQGANKGDRNDYARSELKVKDLPAEKVGLGGEYHLLEKDYIYEMRFKMSKDWQQEVEFLNSPPDYKDEGTSIIEFKRDYYPEEKEDKRERDATFRIRVTGNYCLMVNYSNPKYGQDYDQKETVKDRNNAIDCSKLFDGNWHTLRIRARWSGAKNGYIIVELDDKNVWDKGVDAQGNIVGALTAFNDSVELGPYLKFGQYNSYWKNGKIKEPSRMHRSFVDYILIAEPSP